MVEEDKYCVDILHQTHAVRKALEKLEKLLLESHLRICVPEGITAGNEGTIVQELLQLYHVDTSR
ncbi:metal-sensing transcriptional repressor [Ktedonobacter sp. SOSP1-52]|uniref:metal-sensing transcriptional repressor n=1 Tax=Ktedonobacter sp. SOSP1-52 TaxID=2778366 RepID=UPI001F247A7E|nr:metal-sensing transcriptional repressor [Ktedonobacter sp. SOSP1-52]